MAVNVANGTDLVAEAIELLNQPGINYSALARELGVGRTTIWRYCQGRNLNRYKARSIISFLKRNSNADHDSQKGVQLMDHGTGQLPVIYLTASDVAIHELLCQAIYRSDLTEVALSRQSSLCRNTIRFIRYNGSPCAAEKIFGLLRALGYHYILPEATIINSQATFPHWEQTVKHCSLPREMNPYRATDVKKFIEELGLEGWEIVSQSSPQADGIYWTISFTVKRPIVVTVPLTDAVATV